MEYLDNFLTVVALICLVDLHFILYSTYTFHWATAHLVSLPHVKHVGGQLECQNGTKLPFFPPTPRQPSLIFYSLDHGLRGISDQAWRPG